MVENSLTVGLHTSIHGVLSKLSEAEQRTELAKSRSYLTQTVGVESADTFCYPMGRQWTFDSSTISLLDELGSACAFCTESRDIGDSDLESGRYELPWYDCNEFPYGSASGRPR